MNTEHSSSNDDDLDGYRAHDRVPRDDASSPQHRLAQDGHPYQGDCPAPYQRESRAGLYAMVTVAALAVVGVVSALVMGLGTNAHASARPDHMQTHGAATPASTPVVAPTQSPKPGPAATASPTIRLLQTQLAQLDYYDGPVNGIDSPAVHQAISYLQRDAGLPQTGFLTTATQHALNRMLAEGNNQMGGS